MAKSDFKIGDKVQLNTGSPNMTVTYIGSDSGNIYCIYWHNASANYPGEFKTVELPADSVYKVS